MVVHGLACLQGRASPLHLLNAALSRRSRTCWCGVCRRKEWWLVLRGPTVVWRAWGGARVILSAVVERNTPLLASPLSGGRDWGCRQCLVAYEQHKQTTEDGAIYLFVPRRLTIANQGCSCSGLPAGR